MVFVPMTAPACTIHDEARNAFISFIAFRVVWRVLEASDGKQSQPDRPALLQSLEGITR